MSQTATAAREPLLRIAKREGTTMPQKIAVRAIAILCWRWSSMRCLSFSSPA